MSDDFVIVSTTDTAEAVSAAQGTQAVETPSDASPAPAKPAEASETPDDDTQETDAPVEAEDRDGEGEADKPAKKGGFQRRIDKLTREKRELEQRLQQAERLAAKPAATDQKPADALPAADAAAAKPQLSQYDTYDAYVEALAEWKIEQKEAAKQQAEAKRAEADQQKAKADTWQSRVKAVSAEEAYADFDEVMDQAEVTISAAMRDVMIESEVGPQLAYHLAKHPKDAERIAKLSPLAAAKELGKIETKLTATAAPAPTPDDKQQPAPTSKAPRPIQPVGSSKTVTTKRPDEMPYQDFRKWRETGGR